MAWVFTRAFLDDMLTAIASGSGADSISLASCSIGLCKSPIAPTVDTVMADIDEATFSGYARVALGTMQAVFVGPDELTMTESGLKTFRPSGSDTTSTIFAQFMTSSDSATLYGVEVLNAPVPLVSPADLLTLVPRIGLDPLANWGNSLVSN